jgi:hypothetical protein
MAKKWLFFVKKRDFKLLYCVMKWINVLKNLRFIHDLQAFLKNRPVSIGTNGLKSKFWAEFTPIFCKKMRIY